MSKPACSIREVRRNWKIYWLGDYGMKTLDYEGTASEALGEAKHDLPPGTLRMVLDGIDKSGEKLLISATVGNGHDQL